jgi:hypothetical protein
VKGGRIFKQSFLQICSLADTDAGIYTCVVSDGFASANATTEITGEQLITAHSPVNVTISTQVV